RPLPRPADWRVPAPTTPPSVHTQHGGGGMGGFVSDFFLPFGVLVAVLLAAVAFGAGLAGALTPEAEPGHSEPEPPPCGGLRVVTPGDTLWAIARRCYPGEHTGRVVDASQRANPGLDAGRLQVGQRLVLPERGR